MSKWALLKSAILRRSDLEVDNRVASIHRFEGFEVVKTRKIIWNGFQLEVDINSEEKPFRAVDNDMAGDREITDSEKSDGYCCSTDTLECFVKDAKRFMSTIDCQECLLVVNVNIKGQLNSLSSLENMINQGAERKDFRLQYLHENRENLFSLISDGSDSADTMASTARAAFYLKNSSTECSSKACQYFSYDLQVQPRHADPDPLISFRDGDVHVLPESCTHKCTIEEQIGTFVMNGSLSCSREEAFESLKKHCRRVGHQSTQQNMPDSSSLHSSESAADERTGLAAFPSPSPSPSVQLCVLTKEQGQSGRVRGSGLFSHHLHGVDNTGRYATGQ